MVGSTTISQTLTTTTLSQTLSYSELNIVVIKADLLHSELTVDVNKAISKI